MGATSCVLKLILGIVNSIFLLVGIAVSALGGILIAFGNNQGFSTFLETTIDKILKNIGIATGQIADINFAGALKPAGIVILIFGLVILGISVVGYVGLSCSNVVLTVYLIIIVVLLLIQVIIVAVFFSGGMNSMFRREALKIIHTKYVNLTDASIYSVGPNVIMSQLQCCGLDSYVDFNNSVSWNRNATLKKGENGDPYQAYLQTPEVCCKTKNNEEVIDYECATKPNVNISNFETGCWNKMMDWVDEYKTPAILISVAVLVVQAILIIFVLIIVCED